MSSKRKCADEELKHVIQLRLDHIQFIDWFDSLAQSDEPRFTSLPLRMNVLGQDLSWKLNAFVGIYWELRYIHTFLSYEYENEATEPRTLECSYSISLIGQSGMPEFVVNDRIHLFPQKDWTMLCRYPSTVWIPEGSLILEPTSPYIVDGGMDFQVEFAVFENEEICPALLKKPRLLEKSFTFMADNLTALYDSKENADFVFASSDNKEYPAHRVILMSRCDVFAAMLRNDTQERRTGRCDVDSIDGETLDALLRFLYSCIVPDIEDLGEKLLIAADKYHLADLKAFCIDSVRKKLSVDNAAHFLVFSDRYCAPKLKMSAMNCIKRDPAKFISLGGLKEVSAHSFEMAEELMLFCVTPVKETTPAV